MTPFGKEYIRTMPEWCNDESPEVFMRDIVSNYALEQKTSTGEPSGVFKMDQKQTQTAAKNVVNKFKKIKGYELDQFMHQYFTRTWEHFDVNKEGKLDIGDMPQFMRYLVSDQSIDLDS